MQIPLMLGILCFISVVVASNEKQLHCPADDPSACEKAERDQELIGKSMLGDYSLTALPTASSGVVLAEREELLRSVNFQALASDFRRLIVLASIADIGATGYGDVNLRNHVQRVAKDVSTLHGKSATTVGTFKETSEVVLQELRAAFNHLLEGSSDKAVEIFGRIAQRAEDMARVAEELHSESEEDGRRTHQVLEETMRAKGVAEEKRQQLVQKQKDLEIAKARMDELQKNALDAERIAQQMAQEAEKAAQEARRKRKKKKKGWGMITHTLGKLVGHDNTKKYRKREEAAREDQRRFNAQKQQQHELYLKAQRDAQSLAKSIADNQINANLANSGIEALHSAVGTFRSLSTTMLKVIEFWKNLHGHFEGMQNPVVRREVEEVVNHLEEEGDQDMNVWKSPSFQARAVHFYSQWMALLGECTYYMDASRQLQDQSVKYLQGSSSAQDAEAKIRNLKAELH